MRNLKNAAMNGYFAVFLSNQFISLKSFDVILFLMEYLSIIFGIEVYR